MELASLSDGELVPGAVAAVLGVRGQPERSITEALVNSLRSRRMLLILDNCEHLTEACAGLVDALLGGCEGLRVMATSREALGAAGEVNWIVPTLTVPDAESPPDPQDLARFESVRLFVERARSRQPDFALTPENAAAVVDICRRLNGIPLAIELATARMGALTVEQIAGRLDDSLGFLTTGDRTRAPHQRTLRVALAWGCALLSEPEEKLFARLSVFAGGWTLEAAVTVGAAEDVQPGRSWTCSPAVKQVICAGRNARGEGRGPLQDARADTATPSSCSIAAQGRARCEIGTRPPSRRWRRGPYGAEGLPSGRVDATPRSVEERNLRAAMAWAPPKATSRPPRRWVGRCGRTGSTGATP